MLFLFLLLIVLPRANIHAQLMPIWDDNGVRVAWAASLQAWDVRFVAPRSASLVIPQLCRANTSCHTRIPTGIFACSELRSELVGGNWHNEHLAFVADSCLAALSPMPATDAQWQTAVTSYSSTHDVHVVWPLAVRIYHNPDSGALAPFISPTDWTLKLRLLYVTRFVNSPVVAVYIETFTVPLRLPQNNILTLAVQHECARRGLQAPLLSTMDLFVNAHRDKVCIWDCRHDCFRVPWNSAPPLQNNLHFSLANPIDTSRVINSTVNTISKSTINTTINTTIATTTITTPVQTQLRVCQALPSSFLAVEFDFVLQVDGVTSPGLLDDPFLAQLDAAADQMSIEATEKNKRESTILLSITNSAYNYIQFDNFILRAISFRRQTDRYSVAENTLYVPQETQPETPPTSAPARRLLQDTSSTSFVVQGLCVIAGTSLPAQTIETNLRSSLLSVPVTTFYNNARDKYGLQIMRVHTIKADEQPAPSPPPSARVIHTVASVMPYGILYAVLAIIAACCCCAVLCAQRTDKHDFA